MPLAFFTCSHLARPNFLFQHHRHFRANRNPTYLGADHTSSRYGPPKTIITLLVVPAKYCARATCGRFATISCGVCSRTHYCSVQCRIHDWPQHKQFCRSTLIHQKISLFLSLYLSHSSTITITITLAHLHKALLETCKAFHLTELLARASFARIAADEKGRNWPI